MAVLSGASSGSEARTVVSREHGGRARNAYAAQS